MANLQLSLALLANDRSMPVINGTARADGIDFTVTVGKKGGDIFWRQLHHQEFDVCELSLSDTLMLASRGDRTWVMLPVFMTRSFFHTGILVRADAGIEKPQDLRGKRVAVHEYVQTAGMWARGVLNDEFGVGSDEIYWHQERPESLSHSKFFGLQRTAAHYQYIPPEKSIGSMMLAGELDAAVHYSNRTNWMDRSSINLRQHPAARPLFAKPRAEGIRYFEKTGIFPMNHAPVIRRSIVDKHPWVAMNIYQAFVEAKAQAASQMTNFADIHTTLGWLTPEARAAMDKDALPYGVNNNRKALEACFRHSFEQGLSPRLVGLDEVFAAATMDF